MAKKKEGENAKIKKKVGKKAYNFNEYITKPILEKIPKWRRQNQTEKWIAKKIGVGYTKFREWKKEYPILAIALEGGEEDLVLNLEETLYSKAEGFVKTIKEYVYDKDGNIKSVKSKEIYVHSDKALEMVLRTLRPEKWGNKNPVNNGGIEPIINVNIRPAKKRGDD